MSDFIVETDLGHDPDDFFAICHLIAAGHTIRAISLVPGSPEQVSLAGMIRAKTGQDFEIGVAKTNCKSENLGVHRKLMEREGAGEVFSDGFSEDVIRRAARSFPYCDVLVIGPAIGVGKVATERIGFGHITFQGGFLPYSLYSPDVRLPQFEGKESVQTFNFNGCKTGLENILATNARHRHFVGKNFCHTVVFDREKYAQLAEERCEASRLYRECMRLYLEKHKEKKFHDPTALACHLYTEIGVWFLGRPARKDGAWTTEVGSDYVLADADRVALWDILLNWK